MLGGLLGGGAGGQLPGGLGGLLDGLGGTGGGGLPTGTIQDAAITSAKIDSGSVTRSKIAAGLLADWAVVDSKGTLVRSQPSGVASTRIAAGRYAVTFPDVVEQCAYQVSIASPNDQPPTQSQSTAGPHSWR